MNYIQSTDLKLLWVYDANAFHTLIVSYRIVDQKKFVENYANIIQTNLVQFSLSLPQFCFTISMKT